MPYFPILVDLFQKNVLVIGGGLVAQRKIETLLEQGARVRCVARELTSILQQYVKSDKIQFIGQEFKEQHLDDSFMVIAATDDSRLNRRVSQHAKERGLLINAVDQPSDCNFIVPSTLRRGDLVIAVSTSGKSPALAKKIRKTLEDTFEDEYGAYLSLLGQLRKEILSRGMSQDEKGRIFHDLVHSSILRKIVEKDWGAVAAMINRIADTDWSGDDVMDWVSTVENA